jgi:dolichol-phosphate mannosyltransferase
MTIVNSNRLSHTPNGSRSDWKIPDYRIEFWQQKTKRYCLIIPVINEGDRIRSFIRRLNEHAVHELVDIIIVDGGTTDGSLQQDDLLDSNIRGLLTKLGAGKLSAQLRVAYGFGLENEYAGIITIDGNNKDDPAAIKNFVEALDQGYDFVQASRFVPGGRHSNTPLSRYLAIKLIHAPLLSMASGFPWTDTTQGFRAYSASSLIDDRVSPFRDVFMDYELLAYLSYRLPKLNYRCIELPTVRDYPEGEVPTKISAFKGNFALIKTLSKTCLGGYDPS